MVAKKRAAPVKKAGKKPVAKKVPGKKPAAKPLAAKRPAKTIAAKKPATKPAVKKPAGKPATKQAAPKPAIKPPAAKRAARPHGIPEQLRDAALKVLDDRQAEDIVTVDLYGRSSVADYVIIASARAARQSGAVAHYLREAFAKLGIDQVRVEGVAEGNWVLIDAGDVIIHLFRPEVRSYYDLEEIWQRRSSPSA